MMELDRNFKTESALADTLRQNGFAHEFVCLRAVDSTMEAARELRGRIDGDFTVLAEEQRAGKGRQGRTWESPRGNFYATSCLRSQVDLSALTGLSLLVGVAVKRACTEAVGFTPQLKWPNDIYTEDGRKLGGILVEVLADASAPKVLAGIGMNLLPHETDLPAVASLSELTGTKLSVAEFGEVLFPELLALWNQFQSKGLSSVRSEWLSAAYGWNQMFEVRSDPEAKDSIKGVFSGIDESGCLLLRTGEGTKKIVSGHVVQIGDRLPAF